MITLNCHAAWGKAVSPLIRYADLEPLILGLAEWRETLPSGRKAQVREAPRLIGAFRSPTLTLYGRLQFGCRSGFLLADCRDQRASPEPI